MLRAQFNLIIRSPRATASRDTHSHQRLSELLSAVSGECGRETGNVLWKTCNQKSNLTMKRNPNTTAGVQNCYGSVGAPVHVKRRVGARKPWLTVRKEQENMIHSSVVTVHRL
ncbi:hypothetical protein Sjap_009963 [Stephania japonica]|uniref:Uncharacterized protein n=1 Tax=Stephania japonica TaxID=461633 RepID=A0AAP0P6P8_9MAGN